MPGWCLLGFRPQVRVGRLDDGLRIIGAGQQKQVERVVIQELGRLAEIADDGPHRWRGDAEGHLDGFCRNVRVDTAAHAAGATRDEDRVARITTLEDDFVAAKQGGHGVGIVHRAVLQVDDAVKRQRTRHTSHRIDADLFDVSVSRQ